MVLVNRGIDMLLYGKAVSQGIVIGTAFVYRPFRFQEEEYHIMPGDEDVELAVLENAKKAAAEELKLLKMKLEGKHSKQAEILDAHLSILQDMEMQKMIREVICVDHSPAALAVQQVYMNFAMELEKVEDPIIKGRAADLRDVGERLARCCTGGHQCDLSILNVGTILVAEDILPSEMVFLDRERVLAIVMEKGNENSHTAILARSFGIPTVLGVKELLNNVQNGETIVVDAEKGEVAFGLSQEEVEKYTRCCEEHRLQEIQRRTYFKRPGSTADGEKIHIDLNVSGCDEQEFTMAQYVDGVGLFRTEFLYMDTSSPPDETTQFGVYRRILETFQNKPVIIRTLDIGGDKKVAYMNLPREENPFLGLRGLRLCLAKEELFRTQLRALLRASIYGQLWIMFPMVTGLEELNRAKTILEDCRRELLIENIPVAKKINIGVMIEVPALALISKMVAYKVDFASIGTNDLCQYVTASDRMNQEVSGCYQIMHPGHLRLIADVANAFHTAGKPLSVCGEMGGDPDGAALLVGLGVRKLSMSVSRIAGVKQRLANFTLKQLQDIADYCLNLESADTVLAYCKKMLS